METIDRTLQYLAYDVTYQMHLFIYLATSQLTLNWPYLTVVRPIDFMLINHIEDISKTFRAYCQIRCKLQITARRPGYCSLTCFARINNETEHPSLLKQ